MKDHDDSREPCPQESPCRSGGSPSAPDKKATQEHGSSSSCRSCTDTTCEARSQRAGEPDREYAARQKLSQRMCRIGYKIIVMSGKGGVGKSSVATNLAISLSLTGKSVGLLDVDIHGPSIPRLLGLSDQRAVISEGEMIPQEIGPNLRAMSLGFLVESPRDAVLWRGPMKYGVIRQLLADVAWGPLDYLIVDAPPGTGDEPLSVAEMIEPPAGAVLVTTPQQLSIADVRRSVTFCEKMELPVLGIVENMSGWTCPHCRESVDLFSSGGGANLAEETSVPYLGSIPIDPDIVRCGDEGVPYVHRFSENPSAQSLASIAEKIITKTATAVEGRPQGI